jgi:HSP20 family protein
MKALVPFTGFPSLRKEMDRLFDRFMDWELPELRPFGEWSPSLDFSETKDAYTVKIEVPGIDPKEISVTLDNQTLTVKGEKAQEKETKEEQYYRMERAYGAFMRSVRLPAPVEAAKVTAAFKNGLLTVTMPKSPGAKGTMIPVKAE